MIVPCNLKVRADTDLWEDRGQVVLAFEHSKDGTNDPSSTHEFSFVYPMVRMGF